MSWNTARASNWLKTGRWSEHCRLETSHFGWCQVIFPTLVGATAMVQQSQQSSTVSMSFCRCSKGSSSHVPWMNFCDDSGFKDKTKMASPGHSELGYQFWTTNLFVLNPSQSLRTVMLTPNKNNDTDRENKQETANSFVKTLESYSGNDFELPSNLHKTITIHKLSPTSNL